MWRLLVAVVLLYVAFDFADLMMPGAMNFDPDQSVDVAYAPNVRGEAPLPAVPMVMHVALAPVLDGQKSTGHVARPVASPGLRQIRGPRAFVAESGSASSPDDH